MCFTETFLQPQQLLEHNQLAMQEECMVYRIDRAQRDTEDPAKGGIMVMSQLEVVSIMATSAHSSCSMCIVAVYKRPQILVAFLK